MECLAAAQKVLEGSSCPACAERAGGWPGGKAAHPAGRLDDDGDGQVDVVGVDQAHRHARVARKSRMHRVVRQHLRGARAAMILTLRFWRAVIGCRCHDSKYSPQYTC